MPDATTVIETQRKSFEIWEYPTIGKNNDPAAQPYQWACIDVLENSVNKELTLQEPELKDDPKENEQIQELEQKLEKQIALVEQIQQQLQSIAIELNETLLNRIVSCCQKVCEKILRKSLNADPTLLDNMIDSILADVTPYTECTVFLAEADYEDLKSRLSTQTTVQYKINTSLQAGDFRIQTNHGEIEAILTDRLEKLFRLQS